MADLPRPVAAVAARFAKHGTVEGAERLSGKLVAVTATGFAGWDWKPGQSVHLLLPGGAVREYSPWSYDASGRTTFLIDLHSGGPGARWAAAVHSGERVDAIGSPEGRLTGGPAPTWLLLGDLSAAGALSALAASAPAGTQVLAGVSGLEGAAVEGLTAVDDPGGWAGGLGLTGPVWAACAGEAREVQQWRAALREAYGLGRRDVAVSAFWKR